MNNDVKLIRSALSRLSKPGAVLRQISGEAWGVYASSTKTEEPNLKLKVSQILKMRSSDFIRLERDGTARLTDAGRSWCAREATGADPFLSQHQERGVEQLRGTGDRIETVTVNHAESPLSWLRSRKDKSGRRLLSDKQFQAGERLRRDFTLGHLQPNTTSSWSLSSGGANRRRRHGARAQGGQDPSEAALTARKRFNTAIGAVGPELSAPLIEVCCFLRGVAETETKYTWPKRSGKVILQLALSALARHYEEQSKPRQQPPSLMAHLETGYRPAMFPAE